MIVFFPHTSTQNHGCEAILLSIAKMINDAGSNTDDLYLIHQDVEHDKYDSLIKYYKILSYAKRSVRRGSFRWFRIQFYSIFFKDKVIIQYKEFAKYIKQFNTINAFISIGGDNYCYGTPYFLYAVDRYAKKNHKKLVLWGCSIEDNCDEQKLKDLSNFDLIIARESLTYKYLKSKLTNTILCLPDPAFTLKQDEDFNYLIPSNSVGINISPMIMDYETESNKGKAYNNYRELIRYILSQTPYNIALIPHVTVSTTDDRIPLNSLYNEFSMFKNRLFMVKEGTCNQIKYSISQCRFFVGARTHATIAAYSSEVPTIVIGYSVKSRGIAVDLFGQEEHFVIPVQSLDNDKTLKNEFIWLINHENMIREVLKRKMPEYIQKAELATIEVLKEIGNCEQGYK